MAEKKKLAIIDGKSVFYRGYYAMGYLSTSDGIPTGGVYGFATMALELLKKLKPDYVCVAWDKPKTNIRRRLELYPDYKAGRKPAPPDFYEQIPLLHELLAAFNWPLYELDDYEADDIMYGLAKKADAEGLETMLITSDLDALQGISESTHVYVLKKGFSNIERFDEKAFEDKYKIRIDQFLDLKSLKGDSSDNIPGVPGIGEKTACELLQKYGTLEYILENVETLDIKESVRKKIKEGSSLAILSKNIAQLYDDAPISLDLSSMDVSVLDTAKLKAILKRLEFKTMLRTLPEFMQHKDVAQASDEKKNTPNSFEIDESIEVKIIDHESKLGELQKLDKNELFVWLQKTGESNGVIIIADKSTTCIIDTTDNLLSNKDVVEVISGANIVGYDTKAILKEVLKIGVKDATVRHDLLVAEFIISSIRKVSSYVDLIEERLGLTLPEEIFNNIAEAQNARFVIDTMKKVYLLQSEEMAELTGILFTAEQIDFPVLPVLARLENYGIGVDLSFFDSFKVRLENTISDIEQTIYGYADEEFNIASSKQLSDILFQKLELPTFSIKKGKSGYYSTASDALQKIYDTHPIIGYIETYRELTKLLSTYVIPLPKLIATDGRLHTNFSLVVAQTGRLSSYDPNLQNIPVRTEVGREIREAFVARPGYLFVSADYSQFELRVAAAMSGDEKMIEAFNSDSDIHIETAALIHGVPKEAVTKEMRYAAKAVNFGVLYGQGVHGLSEGTGLSYKEAKEFIDKYFLVRPKLKEMMQKFKEQAIERGYVESFMGRRRYTPDANSNNYIVQQAAIRAAINMPIQGTAADLTKLAMVKLAKKLPEEATQVLQIHDSIMVECREEDAENVSDIMKDIMENIYPKLPVKLKVDVSVGKKWSDL